MELKEKYQMIYRRLLSEVAEIVFVKANGTLRTMLATRDVGSAEQFGFDRPFLLACMDSHDKRCNIKNGNMVVIDLLLGEPRSFNIERLVSINWVGEVNSKDEANKVYMNFKEFDAKYKNSRDTMNVSMDDLVELNGI